MIVIRKYLAGIIILLISLGMMGWLIIPTLIDGLRMQDWPSVQGELLSAQLVENRGEDSTTYSVKARYRYIANGLELTNDRVALDSVADNIGSFQQDLGRDLEQRLASRRPVTVYYNPSDPGQSILNRDIRWGFLGFKSIFVLVFATIGIALIIRRVNKNKVSMNQLSSTEPWLQREDWQNGQIRSDAKRGMFALMVMAVVWNLIAFPLLFKIEEAMQQQAWAGLLVGLFPMVGVYLLYKAIRTLLEWRRYGLTLLTMDPYPGSIAGDVGGEIRISIPFDHNNVAEVELSCLYSYISGSGKNRSRRERLIWQDQGYGQLSPAAKGSVLQFRFNVPDDLPISDPRDGESWHLWRLALKVKNDKHDLERFFEIPVFDTGESSQRISMLSTDFKPHGVAETTIESILPMQKKGIHRRLFYPMWRKPKRSLMLMLFGTVFAAVGFFLWFEAATEGFMLYLMSSIFAVIGCSIILGGVYSAFNSLEVLLDGREIVSRRLLFGVIMKKARANYRDIEQIKAVKSSSGSQGRRHFINYRIEAHGTSGKLILAEQVDSASEKDRVVAFFEQEILDLRH